jgi:uncharacterized membrane protein HdeD (DUF308 family)
MRIRPITGVLLCLVGLLWIGQGVGTVRGSFMTGHAGWAVVGAAALVCGIALLVGARRGRSRHSA